MMKTFDGKKTSWEGLWYHNESHSYWSSAFSLAKLREFKGNVRLFVKKNRYYEKGGNRPNYVFSIQDSKSESPKIATVEDASEQGLDEFCQAYITAEDAASVANFMLDELQDGRYIDDLKCEAESLMRQHSVDVVSI